MLVPGVGTALGGMLGGLGGGVASLASKIPGLSSIIGKGSGILGGTWGPAIRKGIGGLFSGGMGGGTVEVASGDTLSQIAAANNTTVEALLAANPGITDPNMIQIGQKLNIPGGGMGRIGEFILPGQDQKGLFANLGLTGGQQTGSGLFGGGMGGMGGLGLMGLLGKAVYDDTKSRAGGLAQTPQVMMDQLGRYQLSKELGTGGTRGEFGLAPKPAVLNVAGGGPIDNRMYYAKGGVAEIDMRDGGESEGPGTGTSDDIPAMLSDGEFVMTAAATKGAGAFDVNKTKSGIELISGGKASREKGVENMRELMNIFEAI